MSSYFTGVADLPSPPRFQSSNSDHVIVPSFNLSAFPVSASNLWNSLPGQGHLISAAPPLTFYRRRHEIETSDTPAGSHLIVNLAIYLGHSKIRFSLEWPSYLGRINNFDDDQTMMRKMMISTFWNNFLKAPFLCRWLSNLLLFRVVHRCRAGLRHVRCVRPNRAAKFSGAAILDPTKIDLPVWTTMMFSLYGVSCQQIPDSTWAWTGFHFATRCNADQRTNNAATMQMRFANIR